MLVISFPLVPIPSNDAAGDEMILHYSSGLKEEPLTICVNDIFDFSMKVASKYMNPKRVRMLRIIMLQEEPITITRAVDEISRVLCCPKSTVWINVNTLKELGLIENGRGRPVRVTKMGRVFLDALPKGGLRWNSEGMMSGR